MTPAFLVAIILMVLVARGGEFDLLWPMAWVVMGAVIVTHLRRLAWRERYLLALSTVIAGLVWILDPDPLRNLQAALNQAAFLMAFVIVLGILRESAVTSPSISELGAYLTQQPTGRRYSALYLGTGALQVLFNIGVVSFLVPLIQRGIERARPNDPLNPIREQRQISAMQRGFAWGVVWSPTALAPLALFELLPSVDRLAWMAMGLAVFFLMLVIGWGDDTIRFRSYRPATKIVPPAFPKQAALGFLMTSICLLGLAEAAAVAFDETVVFGLLVACPVVTIGWIALQSGILRAGPAATRARLSDLYRVHLDQSSNLAIMLACAGFMGRAAGLLVPSDDLATGLNLYTLPDWVVLSALPVALCLFSMLGFSPIMMAIFFGSLFGGMATLPADATLIALAISCGWGLSMTTSPFATILLLINRMGNIPMPKLSYGWNGRFSALAVLGLTIVFFALSRLYG